MYKLRVVYALLLTPPPVASVYANTIPLPHPPKKTNNDKPKLYI